MSRHEADSRQALNDSDHGRHCIGQTQVADPGNAS